MSDWNKHSKVGGTLLENWVEEREIPDQIIQERTNLRSIQKVGHVGIHVLA